MVHLVIAAAVVLALFGRNNNKHIQCFAFILLFLFAAIRYQYGNDYLSYQELFTMIKAGLDPNDGEPLFAVLCQLMPSYYWLIALTSAFFLYMMFRFITKNLPSEYVWVGLFIFVINTNLFLMNLSSLRQCLAVMIFFVAVDMAYERKPVQYIALVALAALFHKSLWVMLPLYFFITDKPVKIWQVLLVVGGVGAALMMVDLQKLAENVAAIFNDKNYIYYAQTDLGTSLRATLLTSCFFIYTLFNLPRLEGKPLAYAKLYLLSPVLGIFAFRMFMFARLQMLFDIFSVVALPLIFINTQKRGAIVINQDNVLLTLWDCVNKYAMPVVLVLIYFLRYYSFFTNEMWEPFFHYDTIFSLL